MSFPELIKVRELELVPISQSHNSFTLKLVCSWCRIVLLPVSVSHTDAFHLSPAFFIRSLFTVSPELFPVSCVSPVFLVPLLWSGCTFGMFGCPLVRLWNTLLCFWTASPPLVSWIYTVSGFMLLHLGLATLQLTLSFTCSPLMSAFGPKAPFFFSPCEH